MERERLLGHACFAIDGGSVKVARQQSRAIEKREPAVDEAAIGGLWRSVVGRSTA